MKLSLASDLRWLVSEGHVIEFNDGSLDLPRAKAPAPVAMEPEAPPVESGAASEVAVEEVPEPPLQESEPVAQDP